MGPIAQWGRKALEETFNMILKVHRCLAGPYDLDLKKGVDFGLKNSVYLDLNSFALSDSDLKQKLYQQCT